MFYATLVGAVPFRHATGDVADKQDETKRGKEHMSQKPDYKPAGYHSVTPSLSLNDPQRFLDFARQAFGAEVPVEMNGPDGSIMHAEVRIGDSNVMVGPPMPNSSQAFGSLYLYVPDVDATYRKALDAGATSVSAPENMFWGDRSATVTDPTGNTWMIAAVVEQVSPEEMRKRSEEWLRSVGQGS